MLSQRLIGQFAEPILASGEGFIPTPLRFDLSQDECGDGILLFIR